MASNSFVEDSLQDPGERQPLLRRTSSTLVARSDQDISKSTRSYSILLRYVVLFAGDFIANLDTSFVIATCSFISSEFNQAALGSWIIVSYNVGYSVALPLYSAFGDRYGSLPPLLGAYLLFGIGCLVSGLAGNLWCMALGRALAGAGGAGMAAMVTYLIDETAPPEQVDSLRSYVNLVAIVGRSSGGPIGGLITDAFGWRWSSIGQIPYVLVCAISVIWLWSISGTPITLKVLPTNAPCAKSAMLRRPIDYTGSLIFAITLISFLLALSMVGHPNLQHLKLMGVFLSVFLIFGGTLIVFELFYTKAPLIPLQKINGALGLQLFLQFLLLFAQFSIVSNTAIYFARTEDASTETAALHLIPVAVGNATGAFLSSKIIQHTKQHKILGVIGLLSCTLGFLLMAFRWHGNTSILESLYILLPSLGVGILSSTQFVILTNTIPSNEMNSFVNLFLLSQQAGMMAGVSGSAALLQVIFRYGMLRSLGSLRDVHQVVARVLNHTKYAFDLSPSILEKVISCYCKGFKVVCLVSAITSIVLQIVLAFMKDRTAK